MNIQLLACDRVSCCEKDSGGYVDQLSTNHKHVMSHLISKIVYIIACPVLTRTCLYITIEHLFD